MRQRRPLETCEPPLSAVPGGFGNQALRPRITALKGEVITSQARPTAAQTQRLEEYSKQLNEIVTQINAWITTNLPGLQKQLTDANIRPTVGEPIKPLARPQ